MKLITIKEAANIFEIAEVRIHQAILIDLPKHIKDGEIVVDLNEVQDFVNKHPVLYDEWKDAYQRTINSIAWRN